MGLVSLVLFLLAAAAPQTDVVSPAVRADGTVTFRLVAPAAHDVAVEGDWGATRATERAALTRDESGAWSVTLGPFPNIVVRYRFLVDGVAVVDQRNSVVLAGNSTVQSVVVVPNALDAFADDRPVPHGAIRIERYYSSTLGIDRRMHVYTPAGYDRSDDRFPVLYLLPGAGGDDALWSVLGRVGFILDNLLAEGRAKPMVVVMPDPRVPDQRPDILPVTPSQDRFSDDLLRDVMPYVARNLRVRTGAGSTAIAGLSTGGAKALLIGLNNLDAFSQVGLFSSGWFPNDLAEVERRHQRLLDDPATPERLKTLWIGVGRDDLSAAFPNTPYLLKMLERHGIKYVYKETDGDHTWINWRRYFHEFAPLLFR